MSVEWGKHFRSLMIGLVAAIPVVLTNWVGTLNLSPDVAALATGALGMIVNAIRLWAERQQAKTQARLSGLSDKPLGADQPSKASIAPFAVSAVAVLIGVLFASPALQALLNARQAKAVISGPTQVASGPVMLSGHASTGQAFIWESATPFVLTDDKCCIALQCATPGWHTAKLTVKSGGFRYSESSSVHSVYVGGSPPPPQPVPPGPTPPGPVPPGPQPPGPGPVPDGKFGLTRSTYETVNKLVSTPNRAAEAKMLASALSGVSARIAAGTLNGWADIAQETIAIFDRLGGSREAWDKAIQAVRKNITSAIGMRPSDADFKDAIDAIAAGLGYVQ
jgi:hypothetical protein